MKNHVLGPDGLYVSRVCVGTSPLGGMPGVYGYDVEAAQAVATVRRALESPINFIDTSNEYGDGESERRIGAALRESEVSRDEVVIASKADPVRDSRKFDGERVRESFRESVGRLGVERLDVFYLHDPERFELDYLLGAGGAFEAIRQLKADGLVRLIGVAGGHVPTMQRLLEIETMDVLLNHNQFTLLDRSADQLIDLALAAGVFFVNAAPYASGILARRMAQRPRYQYREPDPAIVQTVAWLHGVCGEFDVSLAALALQFSTRDSRISSTVVGVSAPDRVDQLIRNDEIHIPDGLWDAVGERLHLDPPGRT